MGKESGKRLNPSEMPFQKIGYDVFDALAQEASRRGNKPAEQMARKETGKSLKKLIRIFDSGQRKLRI